MHETLDIRPVLKVLVSLALSSCQAEVVEWICFAEMMRHVVNLNVAIKYNLQTLYINHNNRTSICLHQQPYL